MNFSKQFSIFSVIVLMLFSCVKIKNPFDVGNTEDGERILFLRTGKGVSEICTMKPDGSDIRVIYRYERGNEYYPQYYHIVPFVPGQLA